MAFIWHLAYVLPMQLVWSLHNIWTIIAIVSEVKVFASIMLALKADLKRSSWWFAHFLETLLLTLTYSSHSNSYSLLGHNILLITSIEILFKTSSFRMNQCSYAWGMLWCTVVISCCKCLCWCFESSITFYQLRHCWYSLFSCQIRVIDHWN